MSLLLERKVPLTPDPPDLSEQFMHNNDYFIKHGSNQLIPEKNVRSVRIMTYNVHMWQGGYN